MTLALHAYEISIFMVFPPQYQHLLTDSYSIYGDGSKILIKQITQTNLNEGH